jgi:hypothetical protein
MDDERKFWDRMENEPVRWYARFDKFRLMKAWKRSINAVYELENKEKQGKTRTKIDRQWYKKAEEWQWDKRAAAWDEYRISERDKQIVAEEAEVIKEQYALKHNRIKDLNEIAQILKEEAKDINKRWVDDVKAVGFEAHHLKQFNDGLLKEYREYLTDIADEMGERVKTTKQEHTGLDITGAAESLFNKFAAFQQKKQDEQSKS